MQAIILLFTGLLATFAADVFAQPRFAGNIAYVIDATTYAVDVEMNGETQRITLTLNGVRAPRVYGTPCEREAAKTAKAFAEDILWENEAVIVSNLRVENTRFHGSIEFDGRNLADVLLSFKQAKPATHNDPWCTG